MATELPSHFIDLVQDAALKSFWRKNTLLNFLRRHHIAETFLGTWQETERKRSFLARLLPQLEKHPQGAQVIREMANSLANQIKFPDLEGWEDTKDKVQAAADAVQALRQYLSAEKDKAEAEKFREEIKRTGRQQKQRAVAKKQGLEDLSERIKSLSKELGTQAAGYAFQNWFYDLVAFFEIMHRRPYVSGGRQIDGSITLEGTTYLTELKFTSRQADAPDVDTFLAKVNDKADNTMGIMVSMAGFSKIAINQASGRRTPLILMDYSHIYLVLGETWSLPEVISRIRRHASQTGEAFLSASEFGK